MGSGDEIAKATVFLASHDSSFGCQVLCALRLPHAVSTSDFDDSTLGGDDHRLRAVVDVESPQDNVDVPLDRSSRDIQRLGNLLIVESFHD